MLDLLDAALLEPGRESKNRGQQSDNDDDQSVDEPEPSDFAVQRDVTDGNQRALNDEQQQPADVDGRVEMNDGVALDAAAKHGTEIARPES